MQEKWGKGVLTFIFLKHEQLACRLCLSLDAAWTVLGDLKTPVVSWRLGCTCYRDRVGVQATPRRSCGPALVITKDVPTGYFPVGLDFPPFILLSSLVFSLACMYFYKLICRFFNEHVRVT